MMMAKTTTAVLAAAFVGAAVAAPARSGVHTTDINGTEIAEQFINLGSPNHDPNEVDCNRYSNLFLPDGVLHTPGVPDAFGRQDIYNYCMASHAQVNPLISFQELNIQVMNWQAQLRTAFKWTINGHRTNDHNPVSADAITFFLQDINGSIIDAYSFYDTNLINGSGTPTPQDPKAIQIANQYVQFGSDNGTPIGLGCTPFAEMFESNGTWHLPGLPDYAQDQIAAACKTQIKPYDILIPSIQRIITVHTWNYMHKIAIRWTIAGAAGNKGYVIPAISVLYLTKDWQITDAWDFYEEGELPPSRL